MENIGYVSLTETNDYVSSHFLSTDSLRESWDKLNESDKIVLLNQSLSDIESLNFVGCRYDSNQKLSFPRNFTKGIIPDDVKISQILGAISRLEEDTTYQSISKGIKSESFGQVSYSYSDNQTFTSSIRPESYRYIKKYIKQVFKFR